MSVLWAGCVPDPRFGPSRVRSRDIALDQPIRPPLLEFAQGCAIISARRLAGGPAPALPCREFA
jgi:hypothetical protein